MRYVLDSSTAFKWYVIEPDSAKALKLRADARAGIHELIAPDIFPSEVANALLVAERRARIGSGDFVIHLADLLTDLPRLAAAASLLPRVAQITTIHRVAVYDGLYVALAERENCEFVTADDQLIRTLSPQYPFVIPLAALP